MSDSDFDFDDENGESEGIKNLRKQFKEMSKQNAELQRQLAEAQTSARRATVNETLRGLGANPKLAKYIPADVEPSADAIKAWLEEDGEIFGFKPKAEGESAPEKPQEARQGGSTASQPWAAQPIPQALVEAFQRVQNPDSFGGVPTQGADAQAIAQMKALATEAKGSYHAFEELQRRL